MVDCVHDHSYLCRSHRLFRTPKIHENSFAPFQGIAYNPNTHLNQYLFPQCFNGSCLSHRLWHVDKLSCNVVPQWPRQHFCSPLSWSQWNISRRIRSGRSYTPGPYLQHRLRSPLPDLGHRVLDELLAYQSDHQHLIFHYFDLLLPNHLGRCLRLHLVHDLLF